MLGGLLDWLVSPAKKARYDENDNKFGEEEDGEDQDHEDGNHKVNEESPGESVLSEDEGVSPWISQTRKCVETFRRHEASPGHLPAERLREALQELSLYPSTSQVQEMLECAGISQEGSRDHVTPGEFCVLATELAQLYTNRPKLPEPRSLRKERIAPVCSYKRKASDAINYQVFLGGSCNPTTWRKDEAIPYLKHQNITFYNPQVRQWKPEMIELEAEAKQNAEVLFFVIDNQTRATVSKVEVAYLLGQGRKIIPVVNSYQKDGSLVAGEVLPQCEQQDMLRSHTLIRDLIERRDITAFSSVQSALMCVPQCIRKNVRVQDITSGNDDCVQYGHLKVGRDLMKLNQVFRNFDTNNTGALSMSDVCLAYRSVMPDTIDTAWLYHVTKSYQSTITFDEFCCLVTEKRKTLFNRSRWKGVLWSAVTALKWVFGLGVSSALSPQPDYDIYLGGSVTQNDWRCQTAIPQLRKHGMSYYTPPTSCTDHMLPREADRQDNCRVLLYVISADTCASAAMVEAAYNLGRGCNMVLCVQPIKGNSLVNGVKLSPRAVSDYNRGRIYLCDLANREGMPCFDDVSEAVSAGIERVKAVKLLPDDTR